MRSVLSALALSFALVVAVLPGIGHAAPADCAFADVNDNGIFDAGDIVVTDAQWLNGTAFVTKHPFVVPAGCVLPDIVSPKAPLFGVSVTATKITWLGSLNYLAAGGKGIVLIADPTKVGPGPGLGDGSFAIGDGVTSSVKIESGGVNGLPASTIAAAQKAVAIIGTGTCSIMKAELIGNRPIQDTRVGVQCGGDLTIRDALIKGSRVNIQSLNGKVDARSFAPLVGSNLAHACDDPALNVMGGGGAPGNNNGILDPGDFPCQIDLAAIGLSPVFQNSAALAAFCLDPTLGGKNRFQAFNDPLIMIAKTGLDVHGVAGGETEILGKYRVTLVSETADINTAHTFINHGVPVPGGAKIWLFAHPTTVTRLPVDHEDMAGPSTGTSNIDSACFESASPVQVGKTAANTLNLTGTPDGAPCKTLPAGFVGVLNGTF